MVRFISPTLFLLTFLLYCPTIEHGVVEFDTPRLWSGQVALFGQGFWSGLLEIWTAFPREEPLIVRDMSWLIDAQLFGFNNPTGAHFGNVLVNALNSVFAFLFLKLSTRRAVPSAVAALLFAVLPVHAEPVAWIMGRKGLLMAMFALLALIANVRAFDASGGRRIAWSVACGCCVVFALLSKISALALVPLLYLHRWGLPHLRSGDAPGRSFDAGRDALELLPHGATSMLIVVWYFDVQVQNGIMANRGLSAADLDHLTNLMTLYPSVAARYGELLLFPRILPVFYDNPAIGVTPSLAWSIAGALVWLAVVAGLVSAYRHRRDLFFLGLAPLLLMVPYSNAIYHGFWVAARYAYLPSLFVASLVAMRLLSSRHRVAAVAFLAGYLGFCTYQSIEFQRHWQDDRTYWISQANSPQASLMAFGGAARALINAFDRKAVGPEGLISARAYVERGFAKRKHLKAAHDPRYIDYLAAHTARLEHLKLEIVRRRRGIVPIAVQEASYRASAKTPVTELSMARTLWDVAVRSKGQDRILHARRSFNHFLRFCSTVPPYEREKRAQLAAFLDRHYADRFQALAGPVHILRQRLIEGRPIAAANSF